MLATLLKPTLPTFREFLYKANTYAAKFGMTVKAISGTRGEAEQNALYAQGRTAPGPRVTAARWLQSNHNYSLAIDVGLFKDGKYLPESSVYRDLGPIGRACGLDWGGYWKSPDYPHFEFPTALSLAEKKKRVENGIPLIHVPEAPVAQTKTWSVEIGGKQIIAKVASTPDVRAVAEALKATLIVDSQAKVITLVPKED